MRPEDIPLRYRQIIDTAAGKTHSENGAVMQALAEILTLVEDEAFLQESKLRGAFEIAADSRNLWRKRALNAGWKHAKEH